jgi:hypothetical protein
LDPPRLTLGVLHFAGTVLTGRRPAGPTGVAPIDFVEPVYVRCRINYFGPDRDGAAAGARGADGLQPLGTRTRLIVAGAAGRPLLPVAELASGARVGAGAVAQSYLADHSDGDPTNVVGLRELGGLLPVGVTVACFARSVDSMPTEDFGSVHKRVVVLVSRDTAELGLGHQRARR